MFDLDSQYVSRPFVGQAACRASNEVVNVRDPFGNIKEVNDYFLSPKIQIQWLADGDHGFKPRRASSKSLSDNMAEAIGAVADFVDSL